MAGERRKRFLVGLARVALGVVVLALVARSLPWSDRLVWRTDGDETSELAGTILGDWKQDEIRFRLAEDAEPPEGWPEATREALAEGEPVRLERNARVGAGTVDWKPGMPRAFASMEPRGLAVTVGLFLFAFSVVVTRWWRLLLVAGCPVSWFDSLRLTFLGMFFNLVVPGLTGGDLVKAVVVAKENPGRRADALVSVVVDRLLGVGTLALIAAVVLLVAGDAFAELRAPLYGLLGAGVLGVVLYANPALRRLLRLSRLADRIPLGDKLRALDRAALLYLRHPFEMALAVVLSLVNHLVIVLGVFSLGIAFGVSTDSVGLVEYLVVVPIANIVSALPLAPGGWGLGEAAYAVLFGMIGANQTLGVAVSVTFRLVMMGFGLFGGLFLLVPGAKAEMREAQAEAPAAEEARERPASDARV